MSDFHITGLTAVERFVFGTELVDSLGTGIWVLLLSPLIAVFVLAIGSFAYKGLGVRVVRGPFIVGLVAWLFALLHELSYPVLFVGRAETLVIVVEETLEFGGTLLLCLSAAVALWSQMASRSAFTRLRGRRILLSLAGVAAVAAILGSLTVAFLFRVPVVDARADHVDTFELTLRDGEAVVQELLMPAYPIGSFRLRFASRPPGNGNVEVRVTEAGRILAEGIAELPVESHPVWRDIELFPKLAEPEGRNVELQVAADVGQDAEFRLGATQTNRYEDGRLWVNGALTWPDQDLEFVAYGAPEPTRSKLEAAWRLLASDWRWPVMLVDLAIAMMLLALIPTLLVIAVVTRSGSSGGSGSRL